MKKLGVLSLILGLFLLSCSDDDDDKRIPVENLPQVAKTFLQTHFQDQEVAFVEQDKDGYEVYLKNGFQIDFYTNGVWENIDGKTRTEMLPIPESILKLDIIDVINSYVTETYPNSTIVEIDKEYIKSHKVQGYEITLNSRLELLFDDAGKFIAIDY